MSAMTEQLIPCWAVLRRQVLVCGEHPAKDESGCGRSSVRLDAGRDRTSCRGTQQSARDAMCALDIASWQTC